MWSSAAYHNPSSDLIFPPGRVSGSKPTMVGWISAVAGAWGEPASAGSAMLGRWERFRERPRVRNWVVRICGKGFVWPEDWRTNLGGSSGFFRWQKARSQNWGQWRAGELGDFGTIREGITEGSHNGFKGHSPCIARCYIIVSGRRRSLRLSLT